MSEVSKETPYARLKRLRAAAEERILAMSEYQVIEESLRKKTARLRKLRLKKEAAETRATARAAKRLGKGGRTPGRVRRHALVQRAESAGRVRYAKRRRRAFQRSTSHRALI